MVEGRFYTGGGPTIRVQVEAALELQNIAACAELLILPGRGPSRFELFKPDDGSRLTITNLTDSSAVLSGPCDWNIPPHGHLELIGMGGQFQVTARFP